MGPSNQNSEKDKSHEEVSRPKFRVERVNPLLRNSKMIMNTMMM